MSMNSKKMDTGSIDLISNLPDALVCHILSFLSTKDAASTSVLLKRWRFFLAFVSNLDLDNLIYDHPEMIRWIKQYMRRSFNAFVDMVMALQGNAPLNKFSLRCRIDCDPSIVNGWILNVLERGVVDLDLSISSEYNYPLPPKVLMSKTLVKLKVAGTDHFNIDVGEVFLPKLNTLHIDNVAFNNESGAAFAKLISGYPVLEELVMIDVMCYLWESFSVSNQTLKRLTIRCDPIGKNPKSVSFDTPNLVYLQYSNAVVVKYPKTKFHILVEVFLSRFGNTPNQIRDAADFLMGISNVKILYLTSGTLKVITRTCKATPVFNNLIHLTIKTSKKLGWESLPNLLENCPNLETLVFEGLNYKDTKQCEDKRLCFKDTNECEDKRLCFKDIDKCVCKPWPGTPICISSSPVKILKILRFGEISSYRDDMDKQKEVIKYFLETMPNLEQVILYYDTPFDGDLSILSSELEKAASPKCNIQVISDNINFPSTVGSSSSTNGLDYFKKSFPV